MGYRLLLSLVLCCAPVLGFTAVEETSEIEIASEKSMAEYWQEVGLPFKLIEGVVTPEKCYETETEFFGCVHALNTVMGASGKKAVLVSEKEVSSGKEPGKLIKDFGAFKIVSLKPSKEGDILELVEAAKKEREENRKIWQAIYKGPVKVPFDEILTFVKTAIPAGKESEVTAAAFNKYLATVKDPHTRITPRAFVDDEGKKSGTSFSGVGVTIRMVKKSMVIQKVTTGGPAAKAGVRPNDIIVGVDGKDVQGLEQEDILKMVKGPVGTSVTIAFKRKEKVVTLKLTRAEIVSKNVEFEVVKNENRAMMGYVKLGDFSRETSCAQMQEAVEKLEGEGSKGLILDLRGNGGGRVNQALCIANLFLEKGKPVFSMMSLTMPMPPRVGRTTMDAKTQLPMVTLIDSGSASASELLSGALQDHQRSFIAGVRSFGKGTAQSVVPWDLDPSIYMIETANYFLLPSGRSNQLSGVLPDTRTVYPSPEPTKEEMFAMREEDLYFNALPPPGVKVKFVQQRPEVVTKLQGCVDKNGLAKKRFADSADAPQAPDYQLLTAQDTLNCTLN